MLELIVLIALTRRVGAVVEKKGHASRRYKVLTVILWFGGEVVGAFIGAIASNGETAPTYVAALVGAAVGAGIAYMIADGAIAVTEEFNHAESIAAGQSQDN